MNLSRVEEWERKGEYVHLNGNRLFVRDSKGDKPCMVLLHGYPTSSLDFHKVLPDLETKYRIIVHDHLGFGLSDKPQDYSYSLVEQADQAIALWQHLGIEEVVIMAHDYGTSIATELIARYNQGVLPLRIRGVILCNGSIHIELADLRIVQRLLSSHFLGYGMAQLSNKWIFEINMRRIWQDSSTIEAGELEDMWQLLKRNKGKKIFHKVSRYITERRFFWHRWIGALERTNLPIHILWAREDPVAVAAIAEQLHEEIPNSTLEWIEGVGHYPMMEAPQQWVQSVLNAATGFPQ